MAAPSPLDLAADLIQARDAQTLGMALALLCPSTLQDLIDAAHLAQASHDAADAVAA
jgi:hypothetical protein